MSMSNIVFIIAGQHAWFAKTVPMVSFADTFAIWICTW